MLIGIDLGTTGVKAVVFDPSGRMIAKKYEAYHQVMVHGKRELQAEKLWNSCSTVLKAVMESYGDRGEAAICVSSFGEGFVCLDEEERAISPVMLLTDDRGGEEFQEFAVKAGEDCIADICGLKPHVSYSLSKILYLKKYHPEIYRKTRHILLMGDFIYYKLSGMFYTDYSLASRTMLFDVHRKCWSKELLAIAGIEEALFSQPVQGGSIIGEASVQVCQKLGLPKKTTLVMGGHDQPVAAVVGQGKQQYTLCSMGTSECITPILQEPLSSVKILQCAHPNEPFMKPGVYNTLAYNVTSGLLTEWSGKVLAKAELLAGENVYRMLEEEMPKEPTRLLVLPYLHGSGTPYLDADTRLDLLGMNETTTRGDIYRAILEGLCLDQRLNLDLLGWDKIGKGGILVTGGGSRSKGWVQMKADILGQPVSRLQCEEAGALGCAILCAAALGIYASMEEAADAMVQVGENISPNLQLDTFYREKYEVYQTLHESCKKANVYTRGKTFVV